MEEHIKTFDSWINESENYEKMMEAEIPWATEETKELLEGKMSEIDILAQESATFEEFVASFEKYAEENSINITVDDDTKDWLKQLYDQSKENIEK